MGYYIQAPSVHKKAEFLCEKYQGQTVDCPKHYKDIPEGKGIVCVVDNGMFEAAAFCYDEREFEAFRAPDSGYQRPRVWVILARAIAEELSGYRR